jgi:hypothetical protein
MRHASHEKAQLPLLLASERAFRVAHGSRCAADALLAEGLEHGATPRCTGKGQCVHWSANAWTLRQRWLGFVHTPAPATTARSIGSISVTTCAQIRTELSRKTLAAREHSLAQDGSPPQTWC